MAFWNIFSNKNKTPQELAIEGNFKAALEGYLSLLEGKKKQDPAIQFQVADLYMKLKKPDKALEYYIKVGEYYGEMGFFNKSVAIFKKALNISPGNSEILSKLAAFNDKVPKYMIDSNILQQARQAAGADDETETPGESLAMAEDGAETREASSSDNDNIFDFKTDINPEDVMDFTSTMPEETPEEPVQADAPSEFEGIDLAGALDLDPVPLDDEPSVKFAGPPTAVTESAPKTRPVALPDDEDIWDEEIAFETAPADLEKQLLSGPPTEDGPDLKEKPAAPLEPAESIVFSSRLSDQGAEDEGMQNFSSLDDALDSLFGSTPVTASTKTKIDEDRRHWVLFKTMPKDVFMAFVLALEDRDYEPGEYIVKQGESGSEMYLISDGTVEVQVASDGRQQTIATLHSGDFFGEASLLTKKPRNASIKAVEPTNVQILHRDELVKLSKSHPSVLAGVKAIYEARVKQNQARQQSN